MSSPKKFSSEAAYTGRLLLDSRPDIGWYLNDVWRIIYYVADYENVRGTGEILKF